MKGSTLFETIATRLLARQGIGVIWKLHLRASASHLNRNWLAALALIGIADAAEAQWAGRARSVQSTRAEQDGGHLRPTQPGKEHQRVCPN